MKYAKVCEGCGISFSTNRDKSRFCSSSCFNDMNKVERKLIKCECCSKEFEAKADHGIWPRFCSRECFLSLCLIPETRRCLSCRNQFRATKSGSTGELKKYCSKECAGIGLRKSDERECANCKKMFYPSNVSQNEDQHTCSAKCKAEYFTGKNSPFFKNGSYTHSTQNEKHILLKRKGYISKYVGEHRVIAGKHIGREIKRGEYVIRVNKNPKDNNPANLFICESNSEFCKRRNGSMPWPEKSNLDTYRGSE